MRQEKGEQEASADQSCDLFQAGSSGSSCFPPTCSLDGWGLAGVAREALEVTAACPQGMFG